MKTNLKETLKIVKKESRYRKKALEFSSFKGVCQNCQNSEHIILSESQRQNPESLKDVFDRKHHVEPVRKVSHEFYQLEDFSKLDRSDVKEK